jgi:large subunit ribosomal protein L23
VHQDAHKTQVRQAVESLFGVKVDSVRISRCPAKPKRRGIHNGVPSELEEGHRAAARGQTIEIFEGAQV